MELLIAALDHLFASIDLYSLCVCILILILFPPMAQVMITVSHDKLPSPSSTVYSSYYDVFINHRGPDVKNTFASHLTRSLISQGLQVFFDKQELEVGHEIPSEIKAAIQGSSVYVAIFSPHYVESHWCLNELDMIGESGKTIIPVFYNVEPSDLRVESKAKEGAYAKAFHEKKQRYPIQTIEKWKGALSHVSNISGLELKTFNQTRRSS